jgi:tetratricopeptide (TPR) repeat protein
VSRNPSRDGSSPISASKWRIVSCMLTVYLLTPGVAAASHTTLPQAAALAAAPTDPDELYRRREDSWSAKRAIDIWSARASSGKDFEASWKLSRAYYWMGTTQPEAEQRSWLDKGTAAGKQAAGIEPNKPEGHFWWAANLGRIAESGKMAGLKYKDEVKDELEKVIKMAPGWQSGSAESALGMWYVKVPNSFPCWCGGDDKKGIELLRQALTYGPHSIHVQYSLAEALADDKKTRPEAIALLQKAIAETSDPDFLPEDKQYKAKASDLLAKLTKK